MTTRRTVLIVEDEVLIGMDMAMSVEDAGFAVMGPFRSVHLALDALTDETPDIALLDLNLGRDETSEPVAERLHDMGRPFVFLTGYAASSHPVIKRFDGVKCMSKPVNMSEITAVISKLV